MEHEYIGKISTDGGHIKDFPFKIRQDMYGFVKTLDMETDDANRANGDYYMHYSDDFPGMAAVISDEKVSILLKMGVYDPESDSIVDEKVVGVGIPRNDIEGLLDDRSK